MSYFFQNFLGGGGGGERGEERETLSGGEGEISRHPPPPPPPLYETLVLIHCLYPYTLSLYTTHLLDLTQTTNCPAMCVLEGAKKRHGLL